MSYRTSSYRRSDPEGPIIEMSSDGSFEIPSTPKEDLDQLDRGIQKQPKTPTTSAQTTSVSATKVVTPLARQNAEKTTTAPSQQQTTTAAGIAAKTAAPSPPSTSSSPSPQTKASEATIKKPEASATAAATTTAPPAPPSSNDPVYEIYELRPQETAPPVALDIAMTVSSDKSDGLRVRVSEQELKVDIQAIKYEGSLRLPHRVDPASARVYRDGEKLRILVDIKTARASE